MVRCQRAVTTTLLVTDLTPFIPKAISGPDQPGMWAMLCWKAKFSPLPLPDGAISPDGELSRRYRPFRSNGAEGGRFVVVHPLTGDHALRRQAKPNCK